MAEMKEVWHRTDIPPGVKVCIGDLSLAFNAEGKLIGLASRGSLEDCHPSVLAKMETSATGLRLTFTAQS